VFVPIPAPALVFFQACIVIASMDLFETEAWYEENLTFNAETDPINQNFEMFGIGDKNFVSNSGPYFALQVFMIGEFLIKSIISAICSRFAKHERARKIGAYFYVKDGGAILINAWLKLFMEGYFDNAICTLINSIALVEAYE